MKKLGIIIILLLGFIKVQADCATGLVGTPVIDSISVDIAGNVTVCWQDIGDPDIAFYAIFVFNPLTGFYTPIDTVFVPGPYCFTMPAALNGSDTSSVDYNIRAYDACPGFTGGAPSLSHGTMYLEYTPDQCNSSILLNWNPYDDFTTGTNVLYNIYVSENAGPYTIAGTVATPITSFNYTGISQASNYNFYIGVVENGGVGPFTSSSNDITVNGGNFLIPPNPTYMYTATVVDSQQIDISFYVDTAADISHYNIRRATSIAGPYTTIGLVSAFQGMSEWHQYSDFSGVNANSSYYFYTVEAINICGDARDVSNVGRTIWVKAKSDGINATNTLTITQYEGWLGNVQSYDILRSVGGVWESSPIATINAFNDTTLYVDDVTSVFFGDGEFCYKVIATEGAAIHPDGGSNPATSFSNESCAWHEPLIYIPNAFVPAGNYNNEFKPILTFPDPENYLFQVYNKWGQKIFETSTPGVAWNGRENNSGVMSKVDAYVYVIEFQAYDGEEHSRRGVVTLLR